MRWKYEVHRRVRWQKTVRAMRTRRKLRGGSRRVALAERGEVGQGEERSRGEIVRDAQDGREGAGEPGAAG